MRLRRYLQAIASNTAGVPTHKLLYDAAQIDRQTALRYDSVLELVMATEQLPAWSSNRMARLVQLPKRHLVDISLLQTLVGVDARRAARHLATFRDLFPDRFVGGVVFHAGPNRYRISDRIVAAPISTLWDP